MPFASLPNACADGLFRGRFPLGTTAAPVFNPPAGTYQSAQSVSISSASPNALIYYTLDGSTPSINSALYSAPIAVPAPDTETITAIAIAPDFLQSPPAAALYQIQSQTATPTMSPIGGTYSSTQVVFLSCATPGASIYFTMDGSTPTTSSQQYTAPLNVNTSRTVKAIAAAGGYTVSNLATQIYVIQAAQQTATPTFAPIAGSYGATQSVSISCATPSATIYYTTDGSTPTTSSAVYSVPIQVAATQTINAIATASGFTQSAVGSAAYTILITATPTFTPPAGNYSSAQNVAINCASPPGAAIYYTTNGSTPTTSSTLYTGPVTVNATEQLQAIAVASGYENSAVAIGNYTIGALQFDYFMAPFGDDTLGNGSLGNPWSITAINAKQSTYAGKRVGIIGDIGVTLSGISITGTGGQFTCNAATMTVGMYVMITGTFSGVGSIAGYVSGNIYYISATNGSTTGTLTTKGGTKAQPLVTTPGAISGATWLLNQPITYGTSNGVQTTIAALLNAASPNNNPALEVQGGTAAASTYIATCTSAGVYAPRWAIIDASGSTATLNGIVMGQTSQSSSIFPTQPGYTTYDGVAIRGMPFCAIIMDYQAHPQQQNVVIQNCEFYNGVGGSSTNNPGVLRLRNINAGVVHNNKFYDTSTTSGGSPRWGMNAIMIYGNAAGQIDGWIVTNNTVYNCNSCLTKDQNQDFGNCSYNYFDHGNFGSAANSDQGISHGVVDGLQPSAGAVSSFHHNICLGDLYLKPQSGGNLSLGTYQFYNNTFYGTPNYTSFIAVILATANGANPPAPPNGKIAIQFYNNIVYQASGSYDPNCMFIPSSCCAPVNASFNNNVYGSGVNFNVVYNTGGTQINFAAWQSATGCDQNSVSIASTPFASTPLDNVPSSFAVNSLAVIGAITCGALDGSGPIGCNFSNVQ